MDRLHLNNGARWNVRQKSPALGYDHRVRAVLLRRRLGGDGSLLEPFPGRAKGMKRKTWWRLFAKANRDEQRGLIEMAVAVSTLSCGLQVSNRSRQAT